MSMAKVDYWEECLSQAADECGLKLTKEQLSYLAGAAENGHEHYGQAFYSPPASDRISEIERDWKRKYAALEERLRQYEIDAETAVKRVGHMRSDASISIGKRGFITRHD